MTDSPPLIDPHDSDTASTARMYDVWLGGKDNFEVDRRRADAVAAASPWVPEIARANRRCMARAVGWCASQGIGQFLTVGTGLPTLPSPYSAAWGIDPGAVVIGVDNDPVVLAHGRARAVLGENKVQILPGDLREPASILAALDAVDGWDWERPAAADFGAVLHFVADDFDPAGVMAAVRRRLALGSFVIVSHASTDGTPEDVVAGIQEQYRNASAPIRFRSDERIGSFVVGDGFELLEPGVVDVQCWPHPEPPEGHAEVSSPAMPIIGPRVRVAVAVGRRVA
jgi:hypothetical protein